MTDAPEDRTALSWWFPRIQAAGLPVPRTEIVEMPAPAQHAAYCIVAGEQPGQDDMAAFRAFTSMIEDRAKAFGAPLFLRTDHTSGKHGWKDTCYVERATAIDRHVLHIVEYSEMAGIMGLPYDRWALRELLPVKPVGVCPTYGDMPVVREWRCFVEDRSVYCRHPYWPMHALEDGGWIGSEADYKELCSTGPLDGRLCREIFQWAWNAGAAVGGAWSVDILETATGLFVTDMAEADKSYHWPGCENEHRWTRGR